MVGSTIKKIRTSKNYSQAQIVRDTLHQTSYSKFELGKINLTTEHFNIILQRLDIGHDEFEYLHNNHQFTERNYIIQSFLKLRFIDINILEEIIHKAEILLQKDEDQYIQDIYFISKGFISLKQDGNFDTACSYAQQVWERLQKFDTWYLSDIYLINNILFLFPIETAISISHLAITQLERYLDLDVKYHLLTATLQYNLVHLLIREGYFQRALELNEQVIANFKNRKIYFQTTLSMLRQQLLLEKLNKETYIEDNINNLFHLATIIGDQELLEKLDEERTYLTQILQLHL
ncbi:helix-turn-helix domain-containing protein [Metasolibacillus meyeri]|uniref:helix-turn-helix domain-containing protein n=1 Tax=Metasolibacillus meyeri TaxID=1071052 RepID=UPI000D309E32|nr:helix-turn-helix transcriptional regulator [Metasolibacillus meyeri]